MHILLKTITEKNTEIAKYKEYLYDRHITEKEARKKFQTNKSCDHCRDNIYILKQLGWKFVTPIYLHRIGLQPLQEIPFLLTFHDYNNNTEQRMFRSHSQFIMVNEENITPGGDNDIEQKIDDMIENEGNNIKQCVLVDHNPSNCILSKQILIH